jgi:SulP family sulfate permease
MDLIVTLGIMNHFTPQKQTSVPQNLIVTGLVNMSSVVTGSIASAFVIGRSTLNYSSGATNQLSAIFSGIVCLAVGFSCIKLFSCMPMVFLEVMLMALELKIVRMAELYFAFKNDYRTFVTHVVVLISMLFTKGTNAIIIGLFVYLVMQAKDLTRP